MGSVEAAKDIDLFSGYYNTINGTLRSTQETRHSIDPATRRQNPEVPISTRNDVDLVVDAAKDAFKSWSKLDYQDRAKKVLAFADGLEKYIPDFAKLLTQEQGKPLKDSLREAQSAVHWLRSLAALKLEEEIIEEDDETQVVLRHTPLGVSVGIVPWNYPLQLACGKLAPAVLAGNAIIIKPSPFTPYCGLKLGELAQRYFPPGVVQVLSGDDNLGPWLTAHPGPDKISFTGSTVTGKKVMESAAKTLKRVTLELGGKDAAIICRNVNIRAVAQKVATIAFANSGQTCVTIKRIYVHEDIYAQFRDALADFTRNLKVGDGREEDTVLGPVQNAVQYERVKTFFDDVSKSSQTVITGGKNEYGADTGYFITPTIVDQPAEDSRIATEEPFGPILPVLTWSSERDVIARANNTKMGLGASVWSDDLDEASRIARQVEAGNVWINTHLELSPNVPFGGHKESGLGQEWGISGIKSFCNAQVLYLKKKP